MAPATSPSGCRGPGANRPRSRLLASLLSPWRVVFLLPLARSHVAQHSVTIESSVAASSDDARIRCIAGANACPPEDVDGPPGYFELLAALKDPAHQEHATMLKWVGGSFDPAAFVIADVNERLAAIRA